ncbi:unnamed protein product [Rotaria socialis]|uniref:Uncharacterized protein n=1 Tax=Rotaria socialis TaxID=392032 RepID=A0A817UPJ4_9BILA|nr:unnamed protein product [Rotaria socialis]
MLKLLLGLFILGLHPHPDNGLDGVEWYRNEMTKTVIPLYSTVYQMLNKDIIERILHFDENSSEISLNTKDEVNHNLEDEAVAKSEEEKDNHQSKDEIHSKPEEQSEEETTEKMTTVEQVTETDTTEIEQMSEQMVSDEPFDDKLTMNEHNAIDKESGESMDGLATTENLDDDKKLNSNESEDIESDKAVNTSERTEHAPAINVENTAASFVLQYDQADMYMIFAEQVVREREVALRNAEYQRDEVWEGVRKARLCRNGRRKKRFFGDWWYKNIERPVVQATHFVIVKPICSVVNMNGIEIAKDARDLAENTLNDARQRLVTQQQVLADKRTQLSQMKPVETTRSHCSYPPKTLKKQLKGLVYFELVVNPLKQLAEQMIKDELMQSFSFTTSKNTIAAVDQVLDGLTDKLERLPVLDQKS